MKCPEQANVQRKKVKKKKKERKQTNGCLWLGEQEGKTGYLFEVMKILN